MLKDSKNNTPKVYATERHKEQTDEVKKQITVNKVKKPILCSSVH